MSNAAKNSQLSPEDIEFMRQVERLSTIPEEPLGQQISEVAADLAKQTKATVAGAALAGTLMGSGILNTAPAGASEAKPMVVKAAPAPASPAVPPMPAFAAEKSSVNTGDSYWRIIDRDTNLPDSKIAAAIPIVRAVNSQAENHVLHPGDQLYVKFLDAVGMQAPTPAATNVETSINYTVQANDTAWDIARRFGVPLDKLAADNQLGDASLIHPGQQFVIKKSQPAPIAPAPPAPTPPPAKPNYYKDVVTGQKSAGVVVVPKGATGQDVLEATAEVTGIPAADLEPGFDKMNDLELDEKIKKKAAAVVPGLPSNLTDEVKEKIIAELKAKAAASTTTTKPAPSTTSTTEAPQTTTTTKPDIPPMPKGESMEFSNKQGLSIDQLAAVVGGINDVSPETAKLWLEKANKDHSSKITLPGVSEAEWKKAWEDIVKMANVMKWNAAVAAQVEAPGLKNPPNMQQLSQGYYQLPTAPNGEYTTATNNPIVYSGSKALVEGVFTWASNQAAKHPDAKLIIGDMNAADGHASHMNGVDVDITVEGKKAANMYTASRDANVGLAEDIISAGGPGFVKKIFFGDRTVIERVNNWAAATGNGNGIMEYWPNHETHFHVRIADKFRLATVANAPAPLPPSPAPTPAPQPAPVEVNHTQKFDVNFNVTSHSGLTANQINAYLAKNAPAEAGLGEAFVRIENTYNVNSWFAIKHSFIESTRGTSALAQRNHNLFGRNAYDGVELQTGLNSNSFAASVEEYGRFLNYYYLTSPGGQPANPEKLSGWKSTDTPGMYNSGGTTISNIFVHYSTAGQKEAESIANLMNEDWAEINSLPK